MTSDDHRHPLYQKYFAIQFTIPMWFETIHLYKGQIFIGEPLERARRALAEAREALKDHTLQLVAEDLANAGGYKRYAICRWDILHHYLSYTTYGRYCYAMVLPTENPRGFPLMLDLDGSKDRKQFLADVRVLLAYIREWVARDVSEGLAGQLNFLIDDLCHPTPAKQSMHIMCRQIGFRTTELARAFAAHLKRNVCQWVDLGIPKNEGCYKLPGNWKRATAGAPIRAQRPNNDLLDLPPLDGSEAFALVVPRAVFDDRRPWFTDAELDDNRIWWPRMLGHRFVAAAPAVTVTLDWTEAAKIWPRLRPTNFKFVYVNEHGEDRFLVRPPAQLETLAQLKEALEAGEMAHGTAHHVMAEIRHDQWLVLWCDNEAARQKAEDLLGLMSPVATTCGIFAWYDITGTELALVISQPAQRARLLESGLLPPSVSLSEFSDRWAVLV